MPVPMVTPTWLVLFGEMALQPTHVYYCCYCHCSTARSYLSSQGLPCSWWQRECNGSLRCWQVLGWECSSRPSGCQPGGTQIPSGRFYGQTIPLFGCFLQTSLRVTSYINSLQLNLLLNDISKKMGRLAILGANTWNKQSSWTCNTMCISHVDPSYLLFQTFSVEYLYRYSEWLQPQSVFKALPATICKDGGATFVHCFGPYSGYEWGTRGQAMAYT